MGGYLGGWHAEGVDRIEGPRDGETDGEDSEKLPRVGEKRFQHGRLCG